MLKPTDKLYIKGFKIYRSNSNSDISFKYTMSKKVYNEVILSNIFESDIIAGDMNKSQTDLKKIYNIYHIKNIGNEIKKIDIVHKLSDHQIVIFKKK